MSANNWRICPRCLARERARQEQAKAHAEAQYGKVSAAAYRNLLAQAEDMKSEAEATLREDYELGIDPSGQFYVHYRGSCQECGLEFRYKFEAQVPVEAKKG